MRTAPYFAAPIIVNIDVRKDWILQRRHVQHRRIVVIRAERRKEVELIGKAHACLVDDVRAHSPHVRDRGIVAAHVLCLTLEREEYGWSLSGVVAFRLSESKPIIGRQTGVAAAKILD